MSELLANIRSRIEALGMGFQFIRTMKTNMNGIKRETWLLEYEGDQFVFVAGQKNVTLGWDPSKCPLGKGILEDLREESAAGFAYYQEELAYLKERYQRDIQKANADGDSSKAGTLRSELVEELEALEGEMEESGCMGWDNFITRWNQHLSQCLSPLRTADIGDMIVEVDSRYIEKDMPSLAQAVRTLKQDPFTLATEDEWEYLCNGGARTLFRWGDTLHGVLEEIYNIGTAAGDEKTSSILNRQNMLGLLITYDSYKMEIIDDPTYTKGGDGGCSLCGGDGPIYVLPCYTAFYREQVPEYMDNLSKHYYSYRRILRLP